MRLMGKKQLVFAGLVGIYYCVQFIYCVGACNFYSDVSRFAPCLRENQTLLTQEAASGVYDTAIKLAGIWHIIEWIRSTMLLVCILVGTNLLQAWYATAFSAIYGIVAFVYLHIAAFSADGQACSSVQTTRY